MSSVSFTIDLWFHPCICSTVLIVLIITYRIKIFQLSRRFSQNRGYFSLKKQYSWYNTPTDLHNTHTHKQLIYHTGTM